MNFKSWVYLFLIVVFTLVSWVYYTHNIKGFYGYAKDNERMIDASSMIDTLPPISFKFNSIEPVLSSGFERYRDSMCQLASGKQFEITALFDSTETNNTIYENIGLARAAKIKELFASCIDSNHLVIQSRHEAWGDTANTHIAYELKVSDRLDVTHIDSAMIVGDLNNYEIYFPSNSSEQLNTVKLDETLKRIAHDIKQNHKKIQLIGHTDNVGVPAKNQLLSLKRCLTIKDQLLKLGVPEKQIYTEGRGDQSPKVPNTTEQNRSLNRRVQIIIE